MDRIIEKCIKAFADDYSIVEKKTDVMFEHFVNFCIVSKYAPEAYQDDRLFYDNVHTGAGNDLGIDGILILVNDIVIESVEQFADVAGNKSFNVKFIFIQAKTSSHFDTGVMFKTGHGVQRMLNQDKINGNERICKFKNIIDAIFEKSDKFDNNPECLIYFVTTGTWKDDANLKNVIAKIKQDIKSLNITSKEDFIPIDLDKLRNSYKEVTQSITKSILIEKSVPFPLIECVKEAYLGIIKLTDLLTLITDEDGIMQNSLFYENVRGFMGYNPAILR